ncbi:MAG TPA: hypothetical protein VGW10_14085, partial [Solirubrobacteraceae bacterium]|nr:hypothetical protein [Solirubrobacteraceae bacterium]
MTIGPEHEEPQARGGEESDAFTVAFGDATAGLYGLARKSAGGGGESAMGILFAGNEVVAVRTEGVALDVVEPLRRWKVTFEGAFDLDLEALVAPAEVEIAGMHGYEQLCRVTG